MLFGQVITQEVEAICPRYESGFVLREVRDLAEVKNDFGDLGTLDD